MSVAWSTPMWPKLPNSPPAACASRARITAAISEATATLAKAVGSGSGRRAHCWPRATPATAPTISSATHTGPSGGVGTAARMGSAGMSPPNTVKALNVAKPIWALEPTAIAAAPITTLGRYSSDSRARLSWPKNESVMPNSSCIVPQCRTRDTATTAHDSESSAAIPISAGRRASVSQTGNPNLANSREPTCDPTPMRAPSPCMTRTPAKARNAFGVCITVITEAASCTTASEIAAISNGPPSADPMIQRTTNQEPCDGVICAVPRAVAHTISAAGASGSTPSCWPAIEIGTRWVASHMLATAPRVPVRSLLATTS